MAISLYKILRVGQAKNVINKTRHGLRSGIGVKYNVTLYPNLIDADDRHIISSNNGNNNGITNEEGNLSFSPSLYWSLIGFGFLSVFLALMILLIGQCKRNEENYYEYEGCEAEVNTDDKKERMRLFESK